MCDFEPQVMTSHRSHLSGGFATVDYFDETGPAFYDHATFFQFHGFTRTGFSLVEKMKACWHQLSDSNQVISSGQ